MKPFLFKRGKFYQLQYFNEGEQKVKRVSTKCSKKNDGIKFLIDFQGIRISPKQITRTYLNFQMNIKII